MTREDARDDRLRGVRVVREEDESEGSFAEAAKTREGEKQTSQARKEGVETPEETDDDDEDDAWYDVVTGSVYKRWNVALGVVLVGLSAWFGVEDVGGGETWKYTGVASAVLLGRTVARGVVMVVVFVLENVLPLDQVAYYFDVLSPALTTLLWFVGVAVMWGVFFSESAIGVDTHKSVVKILILIALFLASRCVALLMVKMLTARLHAGTFWEQLKTTVRHEVMLKNLTGAPVRPRPNRPRGSIHRSSSFSKVKSAEVARKLSGIAPASKHSRENSATDELVPEHAAQAVQDIHETLTAKTETKAEVEGTAWEYDETNIRLAAEQAEALMKNTSVNDFEDPKNEFSFFSTLSVFKQHKTASYMTRFGNAERILDRAKMTLGTESFSSETDVEMRRASRLIFNHIRRPGQKFITKDAIRDFLPAKDVDEALELLSGQEGFGFSAVGFTDLCRGIRKMFDERYLLGQTLQSMQGLAETLGRSLQILFFFIVVIIGLFMFNVDVGSLWLLFSSSVLALTFIFGSSASRAFEAAVMIFAVHPFNIGDWIVVDGANYKVIELGIHATKLLDLFNEVMYMPTSMIASKPIVNLSRSPELWLRVAVEIDMGITPSQCKHLENVAKQFMSTDKRNYGSSCLVVLRGLHDRLKVELNVIYCLAFNGSQRLAMLEAQSRMIFVVMQALVDMGVSFTGTDGMIFCHNPASLDAVLDPSTVATGIPATGVPVPAVADASRVDAARAAADPYNRYPPHTSTWRSQAMRENYAMTSNLRHLSGMLKMD
jgi:small-conductance mechanosensitive channel